MAPVQALLVMQVTKQVTMDPFLRSLPQVPGHWQKSSPDPHEVVQGSGVHLLHLRDQQRNAPLDPDNPIISQSGAKLKHHLGPHESPTAQSPE